MVKAWMLLLSIFAGATCEAAPMVLKCNAVWDGPIIQTLTVDLEGAMDEMGRQREIQNQIDDRPLHHWFARKR